MNVEPSRYGSKKKQRERVSLTQTKGIVRDNDEEDTRVTVILSNSDTG